MTATMRTASLERARLAPVPQEAARRAAAPRTILVIDDDPEIRLALADVLTDEGYLVRCAADGREGLKLLAESPCPDLILLDLAMPGMDGRAFLEARGRTREVPVIVVSATIEPGERLPGVETLRKPIDLDRLLAAVERGAR